MNLSLKQIEKAGGLKFATHSWTNLGVFSSEADLVTHDVNPAKTNSVIIAKSSDCILNFKTKKAFV